MRLALVVRYYLGTILISWLLLYRSLALFTVNDQLKELFLNNQNFVWRIRKWHNGVCIVLAMRKNIFQIKVHIAVTYRIEFSDTFRLI